MFTKLCLYIYKLLADFRSFCKSFLKYYQSQWVKKRSSKSLIKIYLKLCNITYVSDQTKSEESLTDK